MSVAKTTVDKLLKGYDIRLRPDFGGMWCKCAWFVGLVTKATDVLLGDALDILTFLTLKFCSEILGQVVLLFYQLFY